MFHKSQITIAAICLSCLFLTQVAFAKEPSALPPDVSAKKFGHGWRFTNASGMTLYQYEKDEKGSGKSSCNDECATLRPPLLATKKDSKALPNWNLITRQSGEKQWAYRGLPVYTYSRDAFPGAAFGDKNGWSIAFKDIDIPPGMMISKTPIGHVLASNTSSTLYIHSDEQNKQAKCIKRCLDIWPPAKAPRLALAFEDYSIITRKNGISQWAYKGNPLYSYKKDASPGDTNGNMADKSWKAAILEPTAPRPDWVKIVGSDGGLLMANDDGMTLYAYNDDINKVAFRTGEDCYDDCLTDAWAPVLADSKITPIGNWWVDRNVDGDLQWFHKDQPLFLSRHESKPGELKATTIRSHRPWRPIMYRIPFLQGAGS